MPQANPSIQLPIQPTQPGLPLMAWQTKRVLVPSGQTVNSGQLYAYARSAILACPVTNANTISAGPTQDTADAISLDPASSFGLDSGTQVRFRLDDWWFKNPGAADCVVILVWI